MVERIGSGYARLGGRVNGRPRRRSGMAAENEFNAVPVPAMAAELNRYSTGLQPAPSRKYQPKGTRLLLNRFSKSSIMFSVFI